MVDPVSVGEKITASKLNELIGVVNQGFWFAQTVTFTSSGTFTKATYPWLRAIRVRCQGGGGGSAGCAATSGTQGSVGQAGGGGAYAESFITDIAGLPASVTVTVGAGGTAGTSAPGAGGTGGASSFGSLVSAPGGNGGQGGFADVPPSIGGDPGSGGLASAAVGDLRISGESGFTAWTLSTIWHSGSRGGGSILSKTAVTPARAQFGQRAGFAGFLFGGGAAGPSNAASNAAQAGQAGAPGIVILELFA